MVCPFCGHLDTKVVDSRDTNDGRAIRRRRECEKCQSRFSTYEEMEIMKLTVLKRDGTKQEYDKKKIAAGLRKALEKRPVSEERIQKAMVDIEYEIQARESNEIKSKEIGKMVLEKLRELDEVAYIRFASVYKSFKSVESFKREMESLELEKV
ncbi:MAG TPA: transcriptional regulator NrdR [Candidatus Moranbacteria bacterium]|nr:MAG: Transcriptional repressor NrdR [Candidatus Moranbacteria bacterium GW2011_GWC2_45_10]KKT95276.1 MAG: Transcriptional repressor NrdR [Parcubacteria group bacterium GW2011_GWC1_45_14]HAV10967.1 transcriptional regulator NrdR [Candidatus Moranbacteria bacterium]